MIFLLIRIYALILIMMVLMMLLILMMIMTVGVMPKEKQFGTDPLNPDSDGDGVSDAR